MDVLFNFDLFGQNPNLLINQKSKMRTYLSLIISLLTYILFIFIFLYELQEVIYKQNPNIITTKLESEYYNSSITFNENTFMLILVNHNEKLSKYFKLYGQLYLSSKELSVGVQKTFNFSKCESEQLDDDYKDYLGRAFAGEVTTLCPRNLYFKEYENITNFGFLLSINLRECSQIDNDCTYNQTIYNEIRRGKYLFEYTSLHKSNKINVFKHDKPFYSHIFESRLLLATMCEITDYSFYIDELITNENYIFNYSKKESQFHLKRANAKMDIFPDPYSTVTFLMSTSYIKVTVRNYKSLLTAIANSFSLIRLALFIIKKFIKYHVKYAIEEVIIGTNFSFENDESNNIIAKSSSYKNINQSLIDDKSIES
jgi:hypothetical protein